MEKDGLVPMPEAQVEKHTSKLQLLTHVYTVARVAEVCIRVTLRGKCSSKFLNFFFPTRLLFFLRFSINFGSSKIAVIATSIFIWWRTILKF